MEISVELGRATNAVYFDYGKELRVKLHDILAEKDALHLPSVGWVLPVEVLNFMG